MFSNLKQLFSSSNKDLRKRIYFTLFCLAIFSFGSTITVEWANIYTEELGFLEIYNTLHYSPNYYTIITNGYYSIL